MYDYFRFKNNLKKNGSKNFTFVKVRSPHNCSHCLKIVETGTECLTVNPRRNSRRWYCEDCAELMFNVQQAKSALNSVDFDDEGAAYAPRFSALSPSLMNLNLSSMLSATPFAT